MWHFDWQKKYGFSMHSRTRGFSLIESLVAIGILTVALTGPVVLATQSLQGIGPSRDKLIAVNLLQEGYELLRNYRDANVHVIKADLPGPPDPPPWDEGMCQTGGGVPISGCDRQIACGRANCNSPSPQAYTALPLNVDTMTGFYNHAPADATNIPTTFVRRIHLERAPFLSVLLPDDYQIKYTITISWADRFSPKSIQTSGYLTNWR